MEITKAVCSLKTVLNHIEKHLECKLENIVGKSTETSQLIDDIVSDLRLQTFFEQKDDDELRKLHYLLFLNTDSKILSMLENDSSVGHVVGAIPRLSSRVYFALTREYNLLKYMNEIVKLCPVIMVIELLEIILREEKLLPEQHRYDILCTVLQSIVLRLMETECESTLKRIAELFKMLMLCFKKLKIEEEATKKSKEQMANEGYKFAGLISLAYEMIQDDIREDISSPFYKIDIHCNSSNQYFKSELKSKSETIQECYEDVFFRCRELLEELDLDMFLTWYEIKVEGTNLQTLIGEKVFYLCRSLCEKRKENKLSSNIDELISMLRSISKTPVIDTATSGDSVVDLEKSILKNDTIDNKFLELLERLLRTCPLKPDVCVTLLRKLFDARAHPDINPKRIDSIVILALQAFETDKLTTLLRDFLSTCDSEHFLRENANNFSCLIEQISSLRTNDDVDNVDQGETLKINKEQEILRNVALLAFYATMADLKSIIRQGCLERQDTSVIVKIFNQLEPLCSFAIKSKATSTSRPGSVLLQAFKRFLEDDYRNLTILEKEKFNGLVLAFHNQQLIHCDNFLCVSLLPLLHVKDDSDWFLLVDLLALFKILLEATHQESKLCWPILLLHMAQVLENIRWSVATFSNERVLACERAIQATEFLIEHPKEITASLGCWMEKQLNAYSYLTRSYFNKICRHSMTSSVDLHLETLVRESSASHEKFINDYSKNVNTCIIKMGRLIMCCTSKEMLCIIENFSSGNYDHTRFVLNWMTDSIAFISNAVRHYSLENEELIKTAYCCLGYLINNFLNALQKMNALGEGLEWIKPINRIIAVVREFPKHLISTYRFNIMKFVIEEQSKVIETTREFEDHLKKLFVGLCLL